jgi:hypothetical protein
MNDWKFCTYERSEGDISVHTRDCHQVKKGGKGSEENKKKYQYWLTEEQAKKYIRDKGKKIVLCSDCIL